MSSSSSPESVWCNWKEQLVTQQKFDLFRHYSKRIDLQKRNQNKEIAVCSYYVFKWYFWRPIGCVFVIDRTLLYSTITAIS